MIVNLIPYERIGINSSAVLLTVIMSLPWMVPGQAGKITVGLVILHENVVITVDFQRKEPNKGPKLPGS